MARKVRDEGRQVIVDLAVKLGIQPLRSLLAAGIPVALGSDGPTNPYLNIMFAITHPDRPSEAITREQAVIAYTATSAYAKFAEKDKGTLDPGKLADLAVLSQDVFTVPAQVLPKTKSVLTLVGGKAAYDAHVVGATVSYSRKPGLPKRPATSKSPTASNINQRARSCACGVATRS